MLVQVSTLHAIILAAGSSSRFHKEPSKSASGEKKEFLPIQNGKTALALCAQAFLSCGVSRIVIALPQDEKEFKIFQEQAERDLAQVKQAYPACSICFVAGGRTRQESVYRALKFLSPYIDSKKKHAENIVLIHDGARPFVTKKIIDEVAAAAAEYGAAAPAIPAVDTLKTVKDGAISVHLERGSLFAVQTPQAFEFALIFAAHKKAAKSAKNYTDDTEIWSDFMHTPVKITQGDAANKKITYRSDLAALAAGEGTKTFAVGFGWDRHRLVPMRPLMIGGVTIPSDVGEQAHSDGDVLLHALIDALLGAANLPDAQDIGELFPDTDEKWKNADSKMLVKAAWDKLKNNGIEIVNIDCVLALEYPKFSPHRQNVIESIAALLGIKTCQVAVKAKTGEKIGVVGKMEAVEAWVNVLVRKNT